MTVGERFHDFDLLTMSRLGEGMCLLLRGQGAAGMALLDEVMVGVTADEVSPLYAGMAYCTVIAGYRTYPHVDIRETGMRAGTLLLRALKGEIKPVMAFGHIPALMHTLCMDTQAEPFRSFIQKCRDTEGGGVGQGVGQQPG